MAVWYSEEVCNHKKSKYVRCWKECCAMNLKKRSSEQKWEFFKLYNWTVSQMTVLTSKSFILMKKRSLNFTKNSTTDANFLLSPRKLLVLKAHWIKQNIPSFNFSFVSSYFHQRQLSPTEFQLVFALNLTWPVLLKLTGTNIGSIYSSSPAFTVPIKHYPTQVAHFWLKGATFFEFSERLVHRVLLKQNFAADSVLKASLVEENLRASL